MTLIDREMALDLVGLYEQAFIRVHVLEQILNESGVDWQPRLASLEEEHARHTHDMFEQMRQLILHSDDVSSAVGKMLQKLEQKDEDQTDEG